MPVEDLLAARSRWWLFLILGAALIVLGLFALSAMELFTAISVIYFGCLFIIGGAFHIGSAFSARVGSGFFFHLLIGLLDGAVGLLMLARPGAAATVLTALLALMFLVGGLFRAIVAVGAQPPRWGLSLLSGIVGAVLGIVILIDIDENRVWVIGLLVGLDFLSRGIAWVVTALALRQLRGEFPEKA
jgi:uncharacterized membrane protein HdeD (DUF308 family)